MAEPRPDEPTDEALLAEVARHDVAAFGVLYDRYVRLVFAMATRILGPAEAEEIVQDTFLQLWRKARQFDPARGTFAVWFTAIARHRILGQLSARGRLHRLVAAEAIELALEQAVAPGPSLEEIAERGESSATALRALATLPSEQRQVLVLAYFADMSQSAIAAHLDIPLGTVKKRVRLGMQKLRIALTDSAMPAPVARKSGVSDTIDPGGEE